jgi:diaminopimelate decarboxylase
MRLVETIIRDFYRAGPEGLAAGGIPVCALARRFGTPFYAYAPEVFRRKLDRLRRAFPFADVHYSLKANPNPAVVACMVGSGAGLEIASGGELALALACGCPAGRIIFAGPAKRDDELAAAIAARIGEFHAESFTEIDRLALQARDTERAIRVALRVNMGEVARSGAIVMAGGPSPFGIDEERLPEAADLVARSPGLSFAGLHFYAGTQILDADVLLELYAACLERAADTSRATGLPLATIDFGGGFGVPCFEKDCELDLESIAGPAEALVSEYGLKPGFERTRYILEPGRYLVAEGGLYAASVLDVKASRGAVFLILDGGMHHNVAAAGHFGQIIKRNFPIVNATRLGSEPDTVYQIAGPLCTPLDTLGRDVLLPRAEIGDIIVFFLAGAYALTASPVRFLSHPEPAELMVEHGQARIAHCPGPHQRTMVVEPDVAYTFARPDGEA